MHARSRNDPAAYIMARTCMGLSVSSGIHRELLCLLPVNREGEVSDLAGQPTIRAEPAIAKIAPHPCIRWPHAGAEP